MNNKRKRWKKKNRGMEEEKKEVEEEKQKDGRRKEEMEEENYWSNRCYAVRPYVCLPVHKTLADALATPFWTIDDGWQHLTRFYFFFERLPITTTTADVILKREEEKNPPSSPSGKKRKIIDKIPTAAAGRRWNGIIPTKRLQSTVNTKSLLQGRYFFLFFKL